MYLNKNLIKSDWLDLLSDEFSKDYWKELDAFLESEEIDGKEIYPPKELLFNALNLTSFAATKVVILGQDPYHGDGQAHGLSFSVLPNIALPPSLKNIYKELESDLSIIPPGHGHLESWAKSGVLLLNTVLTVEKSKAGSHRKKGWEKFTDKIIELLNDNKDHLVFILWGSPAQKKGAKIDRTKHLVIESVHPSPLSSYRGFFGTRPFSKANEFLLQKKIKPIDWKV